MGSSCSTPFQYPSSGSTDCNSTRQAYGRPLACTLFQYPSSGSTDCNWPRSAPPPGRTPTLSVSLKRIDGLQPPGAQQQRVQPPELFQYPSSGSTDCNLLGVGWHAADLAASFSIPQADRRTATHRFAPWCARLGIPLSVSLKRIDGLQPRSPPPPPTRAGSLSVSLKRIDGLQPETASAMQPGPSGAFSIPQADRRTATRSCACTRRAPASTFQYPSSGSTDCNAAGGAGRLDGPAAPFSI